MSQVEVSMPPGFEAVSILGKGAMGKVYKAWQPKLQRHVAIKTCTLLESEEKGQDFACLQAEALTIAQINHPNIVTLIDVQSDENAIYLIMEHLDGPTLAQLLNPAVTLEQLTGFEDLLNHHENLRTMKETWILETGFCVAKALDYAHGRNVLHRDIKPANIIITEAKNIKLLDFSIAQSEDPKASETNPGGTFGTVQYMAPEQILSDPLDGRADIYSLGCTLYHLATGKAPFVDDNDIAVCMNHVNAVPQDVRELNPSLSASTAEMIMRCLEKDMRERFESADALADHIKKLQRTISTNMKMKAVSVPKAEDDYSTVPTETEEEPPEEKVDLKAPEKSLPAEQEPVQAQPAKAEKVPKEADEEASFSTTKPKRVRKPTSLQELAIKRNEDTDTSFLEAVRMSEGQRSSDPLLPGSTKAVYEPQSFTEKLLDHEAILRQQKRKSTILIYKVIILIVILSISILASYLLLM